jgi:AGCS family alanine or glycine:cation symporter
MKIIDFLNWLLWGDIVTLPLPGGSSIGLSLLVMILIPAGLFFTVRTKFLPIRCFPEMLRISLARDSGDKKSGSLSGMQTLIVSTATRVGMGNMVGVVAAIAAGGAGAVFWMWVTALIGASTAYVEATLAQMYREPDPLYGGTRGGPAHYIHHF